MNLQSLKLHWFRGAAEHADLELGNNSAVIYGANGSGKSSFVDAVEFAIRDGRIEHLAHEYSGRRHEKAIRNTHTPIGVNSILRFAFDNHSEVETVIKSDGSHSSTDANPMRAWEYRRSVLRQSEVSDFIHSTKGEKYSALLPLLGLQRLEYAAENLRQIQRSMDSVSKLKTLEIQNRQSAERRMDRFGAKTEDQILASIIVLKDKYSPDSEEETTGTDLCRELLSAVRARIEVSSDEQKSYLGLRVISDSDVSDQIQTVRTATSLLAGAAEATVVDRLAVLDAAKQFTGNTSHGPEVQCPACGRPIQLADFQVHVDEEIRSLSPVSDTVHVRSAAVNTLCDQLIPVKQALAGDAISAWRRDASADGLATTFDYWDTLDVVRLRTTCTEEQLVELERHVHILVTASDAASAEPPPGAQQLNEDLATLNGATEVFELVDKVDEAQTIRRSLALLSDLEAGVRDEIYRQAISVIESISGDIKHMWEILHPGSPITDVALALPDDSDKAIDITLNFYGASQDSPRLTLSEGFRNSLGLCIFLAMAKADPDISHTLFLDDVVVSMDREHRGMIAGLLTSEFGDRQVVLFTHDRDWFAELRQHLDVRNWNMRMLMPWDGPSVGIRMFGRGSSFDEARTHLDTRPDSAANDARKIMDIELSMVAERFELRLPYLRSGRNDHRMAHEFLERIIADGGQRLRIKNDGEVVRHQEALDVFGTADTLLVSWANRGSHTFDTVRPEAEALIDACEAAIEQFKCDECARYIWYANVEGPERLECECGKIRWRYGSL